jgi:glucoamylase
MNTASSASLDDWADAQARISAAKMAEAVSATGLVKHRPCFGQTVRPARGSVLGAIGSAAAENEPDYFFHWLRDSAAVMDAALVLIRNGIDAGAWRQRFADFVRFSLGLSRISGSRFLSSNPDLRDRTEPQFRQYLRPDDEIAAVEGERALGEVRYNADGTLDFLRWSRPQHDGPALRALTVLRFLKAGAVNGDIGDAAADLLRLDLGYTLRHGCEPCYDIWEEEKAEHYCTCLLQAAALREGSSWAAAAGELDHSHELASAADRIADRLDDFWSPLKGHILSRLMPPGQTSGKDLDSAVILGLIHAGDRPAIAGKRALMTMKALEAAFTPGLAFGRYRGDTYFGGGAWFICTFGAAEFYYKLAAAQCSGNARDAAAAIARGDGILEAARRAIPLSGEISEQFDRTTGEQASARDLAWSHAAFITARQARKDARLALSGKAENLR